MSANAPEWKLLEDVNRSIAQARERIAVQRRQIIERQRDGYSAVGYITLLRELENALSLMSSRRDLIARKLRRRIHGHGAEKIPTSRS